MDGLNRRSFLKAAGAASAGTMLAKNVYALGASQDAEPARPVAALLDFQFGDWLGTRRVLTDYTGNVEETCDSLPYGNGESRGR